MRACVCTGMRVGHVCVWWWCSCLQRLLGQQKSRVGELQTLECTGGIIPIVPDVQTIFPDPCEEANATVSSTFFLLIVQVISMH